jgi:hypothetical protein
MEYIWTSKETTKTGISIDTVRVSKTKPHDIFKDSESIHLDRFIYTGMLLTPTSIKAIIASIVVNKIDEHAIKWEPLTPTFLPNNPDTIEANKGKIITVKYII